MFPALSVMSAHYLEVRTEALVENQQHDKCCCGTVCGMFGKPGKAEPRYLKYALRDEQLLARN